MALINCPKCGKSVSDTAQSCVHCGFDLAALTKQKQAERDYGSLLAEEKKRIRQEYDRNNPSYLLQENRQRKLSRLMFAAIIIVVICVAVCFVLRILKIFVKGDGIFTALIVFLVAAIIVFIAGGIVLLLLKSGRKRELYEQKKYIAWLKNEKKLTYNIILDEKDRQIYNSYKVE